MPRAIWKGMVTFGLVNVPIELYTAESRTELKFHMLDSRNKARVRYSRVNEVTGEEVPWNELVKAYEYDHSTGNYVIIDQKDFEQAAPKTSHTIEIEDFVEKKAIDYVYFDKPYYLVPGKGGEKGYVLLRRALHETGTVGIARVMIRTKEHLAVLLPEDRALVLDIIRFPQELRPTSEYEFPSDSLEEYSVKDRELTMAKQLIENMQTDWQPDKYHDEFRERLQKWIEEKAAKGEAARAPTPQEPEVQQGKVLDMTEVLKQSLEKAGKGKEKNKEKPRKPRKKATG